VVVDDPNDDLFLIDAEQAVQEMLQYGKGEGEFSVERVIATSDYLASLLWSIGLADHGEAVDTLSRHLKELDAVSSRRLARDLSSLVIEQIQAIKAGDSLRDQSIALGQLKARFQDAFPEISRAANGGQSQQDVSQPTKTASGLDEELIRDAAAALHAVDHLASLLGKQTPLHQDNRDGINGDSLDIPNSRVSNSVVCEELELNEGKVVKPLESEAYSQPWSNPSKGSSASTFGDNTYTVDESFRKAVAFQGMEPWRQGFLGVLESIDQIDRVELSRCLPNFLMLRDDTDIAMSATLGRALFDLFSVATGSSGLVEASSSGNTISLTIEFKVLPVVPQLGLRVQSLGGRVHIDYKLNRLSLTLPTSLRLVRLVQVKIGERRFAFSWAQFISHREYGEGKTIELLIGDHSESIVVDSMESPAIAIRYELPREFWKRDQYKGIALTDQGQFIPIYG
jgi:hypothetical protein